VDNTGSSIVVAEPGSSAVPPPKPHQPHPVPPARRRSRVMGVLIVFVGLAALGAGLWNWEHGRKKPATSQGQVRDGHRAGDGAGDGAGALRVDVAHPRKGGIERTTDQAGSIHAFEHADLYAKVSGYLKVQNVDIGDTVKVGQVLAEIDDPEVLKAVDQARAALEQSRAKVKIAEARIKAAEADVKASQALVTQAQVGVQTQEANVRLRTKQLARIQGLVERQAIETKLEDEEQDKFDSARSSERYSRASVLSAQAQELSKRADVEQARADQAEAAANVGVAEANLAKAEVMAGYTKITSPYDGVVTRRTYHRGDFVRSAAEGGAIPILAVARVDLMRVVLPVPDVDVPFVNRGDAAVFRVVALPGEVFRGVVSRFAETEDPESRNMRTEIDLPNPAGRLREGMYGRATIVLQAAAPGSVTIPSSGLTRQDQKGEGSVYVVRDGKARKVGVRVGSDSGVEAEILDGLSVDDPVIVRYNGALADGTPVTAEPAHVAQADH